MTSQTQQQKIAYQQDLMDLMVCRETRHFVENEEAYIDETDERLEEFYETLCDPSFQNRTSNWIAEQELNLKKAGYGF